MFPDSDRPKAQVTLATAEVGAAALVQASSTLTLNRVLNSEALAPDRIADTIASVLRLGLGPKNLPPQLLQGVTQLAEALKNAPTENCVDLGIFGQACIQIGQTVEQIAGPLLNLVRWEVSDAVETVMGPFRMAGLIIIANKHVLPQVYDQAREYLPNDLLAMAAAETLVVAGTALANSILPLFLRGGFGSFGHSFTVGMGVGVVTLLPEWITSAATGDERAGRIAGIVGQVAAAGWLGWPVVETAINFVKLLA